jgi:hypothetical protein
MANFYVHDGDCNVPQITSADTLYIRFQLQDSQSGQGLGKTGELYSDVTAAYAKPGETSMTGFPSFGTANWREVGNGDYELIIRGGTAGELALLNTVGALSFDLTSTAAYFPQKRVKISLVLPTANILAGTAQAGASGSITLPATASAVTDYYNNQVVEVIAGTGAGQARIINGYNATTKVATVSKTWATAPDSTSIVLVSYARHGLMGTDGAYLMSTDDQATAYAKIVAALMGVSPKAFEATCGTHTMAFIFALVGGAHKTTSVDNLDGTTTVTLYKSNGTDVWGTITLTNATSAKPLTGANNTA